MLLLAAHTALAQGSAFTYQGRLTDGGAPSNGTYELEFKLFDAESGGTQQPQPSPLTLQFTGAQAVAVTGGVFTVQLDFGADAFPGAARYLEIGVRHVGDATFNTLSPRQAIAATPYAIRSASAASTTDFSGSLSGDVTGTQSATVVSSVGGQSAATVAGGAAAANSATNANTADTIVKRDASGNFSAGTITANLDGNATTATTATTAAGISASAGNSVVTAINASSSSVNTSHVTGDVELAPSAQQTTSSTNHLINLKLVGSRTLGAPGQDALLSLSASGSYPDNQTYDKERFRVDNDGSILSVADYSGGVNTTSPTEGSGTRFMWYATKAALRAGYVNGTQWDDANIGLYSTAFGENVRALGDNSVAIGKNTVAAGSRTIALGERNTATGYASVALGYGASTSTSAGSPRNGTFVFSDFSNSACDFTNISNDCQFHPSVTNSFNVRAVNGSFFYTSLNLSTSFIFNSTTATMTLTNSKLSMKSDGSTELTSNSGGTAGVSLAAGSGSWGSLSDRNMKANFAAVDTRAILRGVLNLPISTWNYKTQSASVRHIGPMAQDFFATFRVGEGDKTISTIDPDGVALAAIQGLHEELKDRDARIDGLQQQLKQQQDQIDGLKKLLCADHPDAAVCGESR
jgi:hypothetical protein